MKFKKLDKFVNLRGKTAHRGWYNVYEPSVKTDIVIHHSLTDEGDSASFARYHVGKYEGGKLVWGNGWPEIAYHFVILKDGTIEWNHDLGVHSYHVGNWNRQSVGICLVGDFRYSQPTEEQKESLYNLHEALVQDLPNYQVTKGHNEYPDYTWKSCPEFDYKSVLDPKPFTDVSKNHTHFNAIKEAKHLGIVNGYPDGSFKPNEPVTRAQVVAMIMNSINKS